MTLSHTFAALRGDLNAQEQARPDITKRTFSIRNGYDSANTDHNVVQYHYTGEHRVAHLCGGLGFLCIACVGYDRADSADLSRVSFSSEDDGDCAISCR